MPIDPRDPADAWGSFLDPPEPAVPPPPSPAALRAAEPGAPAPDSVIALGPPPDDAMGAAKWAYQVQMQMAHDVIRDPTLPAARRRKELQAILAAAAKWMTDALRFDVAQTIEEDKRQLEAKRRGRASAKPVKRTGAPPLGAKIIPITRDA